MFCNHCREIIERRIKYLEDIDKGKEARDPNRAHVIQQLNWLLKGGQERMDEGLPPDHQKDGDKEKMRWREQLILKN